MVATDGCRIVLFSKKDNKTISAANNKENKSDKNKEVNKTMEQYNRNLAHREMQQQGS